MTAWTETLYKIRAPFLSTPKSDLADTALMQSESILTIRLKVQPQAYAWLNAAACEVNTVFNWANATTIDASDRCRRSCTAKFLSGYDLCGLCGGRVSISSTSARTVIQRVCIQFAATRKTAQKRRLRWRASRGPRRALGWLPFKAASLKRSGKGFTPVRAVLPGVQSGLSGGSALWGRLFFPRCRRRLVPVSSREGPAWSSPPHRSRRWASIWA